MFGERAICCIIKLSEPIHNKETIGIQKKCRCTMKHDYDTYFL